jgi:GTP-binding protein
MSEAVKPIVAIVGRPNVGKSRLFNRLLQSSRSIVFDQPGVTRDRIYADAELVGPNGTIEIVLVDTGGFDPKSTDPIMRRVLEQTQLAIDEADVVVFLTDAQSGLMPEDHDIAELLRKSNKRVVAAVNKIDDSKDDPLAAEFYRLGLGEPIPISAVHGRHVMDLEEMIVEALPSREGDLHVIEEPPEVGEDPSGGSQAIRVAVIGRPNSGKSSLINRLLGEDRHLVSEVPGTTVDAIDSLVEHDGQEYLFIDTAGIRRKRSIAMRVERFSVIAALKGLERSDVALLLIDAEKGVANQDAKVSAFAFEKGKAVILVVSKWDLVQKEEAKKEYEEKLRQEVPHLAYAPVVFTSAHSGYGFDRLMPTIRRVHDEYTRRVGTGKLNRFVEELMKNHPPPSRKGKTGKIYYVTQVGVRPPQFQVSVNDPERIHFSYRRFLVNKIREEYGFGGVPLLVGYRSHKKSDEAKSHAEPGKKRAGKDPTKQATAARRAKKAGKKAPKKFGTKR